ncbi:MAG TPA: STM3941 family protein [Ginsengibacter sp.]
MNDSKQIEIQLSKFKLTLMALGCVMFIVGGICFIINPAKYESFIMKSPTIIFITGILSILFFGFLSFFFLKKLSDKFPGIIISDEGITDNSSGVSAGFIPWTDIIAIKETKVINQKLINIIVKNPQEYIDRQKSAFKRKTMQTNYKTFGTAIGISANGLKSNYDDLKKIIEKSFSDFKKNS